MTWWMARDVPGGMVKMEAVVVWGGKRTTQTTELTETGRGQPE
jgi:hypothetical protein